MFKPIRVEGTYGGPRLRDGLIAVFFKQAPFREWATDVKAALEHWQDTVPAEGISYATVGSSATKRKRTTTRTHAQLAGQLDPVKAASREMSSFELCGPQAINADYHFEVLGNRDAGAKGQRTNTNYVQMRFPTEWAGDDGEQLGRFATEIAKLLRHDSGYASLALHWSVDAEKDAVSQDLQSLVHRHPGYDVHNHFETSYHLGRQCIGARWMTFLGAHLVKKLGGAASLRKKLDSSIQVETTPAKGISLRCAGPPRPGDVNRNDDLPQLRSMAAVLEPVTFFGEDLALFEEDEDFERWQRRFLD